MNGNRKEEYVPYTDIAGTVGISRGDRIYLSSDVLALAWTAKYHGECFSVDKLIDSFQKQITEDGTLLIPTFHFDFSNKGVYDYTNTPCTTGALGNAALKRQDFKRTAHPMHSFCVWGKDQALLCAMCNNNSFGSDSPFAYMHQHNVVQIMLGTDYQRSMTFVHYAEAMAKVPYRFSKQFTGTYIAQDGTESVRTYEYPARYLELGSTEQFNRIGQILEEKGIAQSFQINGISVKKVSLSASYPVIYEDAAYHMCKNLYDFAVERKLIWK
ncbi:MAG: AAC(3) family N-acetyltransferase [Eubacterium sp.]|nr:AAC(3) family N-acetyltransferase [Eubacterium sp.]